MPAPGENYRAAARTVLMCITASMMAPAASAQETPLLLFERDGNRMALRAVARDGTPIGETLAYGSVIGRSPDGSRIAYRSWGAAEPYVGVVSLTGERQVVFTPGADEEFVGGWQTVWSPSGDRLALLVKSGRKATYSLVLFDLTASSAPVRHRLPADVFPRSGFRSFGEWVPYAVRWSPDGRHLLIAGRRTIVVDVATGVHRQLYGRPAVAEWAPSGNAVYLMEAVRGDVPSLQVVSLADARPRVVIPASALRGAGLTPTFLIHTPLLKTSPSQRQLAIVCPAAILLYDLSETDDSPPRTPVSVVRLDASVFAMEWSPDGTALGLLTSAAGDALLDGEERLAFRIYELASGEERVVGRPGPFSGIQDLDFIAGTNTLSWTR